jgi:long-subunit acyl-CoA synthetase (AMP-forming)
MAAPPGGIGTPLPGMELKLLPADGKLEIRVRGPNVFPGYLDEPAANAAAFDAEGYFITGDAVAWVDPADPDQGLRFDGRLVEDFKLSSGTRINALELRLRALAALGPLVRDVVVVGADRDDVGLLVFPADPAAVDAVLRDSGSGAGGQKVNKTSSTAQLRHLPTGIIITTQTERSQSANKDMAFQILRGRLYDLELKRREAEVAARESQKSDVSFGSQIRSYVLQPYRMVKDLRTGVESGQPDKVLDGELEEFITAQLMGVKNPAKSIPD